MKKIAAAVIFTILFAAAAVTAQEAVRTSASPTPAPTPDQKVFTAHLIEIANQSLTEINALRSPENRVVLSISAARLMWDIDDATARRVVDTGIADLKRLLIQANQSILDDMAAEQASPGYSLGMSMNGSAGRARLTVLLQIRDSIASDLSDADPELALRFLDETEPLVTEPDAVKTMQMGDAGLRLKLASSLAAKDPTRALALALESLKAKDLRSEHINVLESLWKSDKKAARTLGAAILSSFKEIDEDNWDVIRPLLSAADSNYRSARAAGVDPIYSAGDMRDLVDTAARLAKDRSWVIDVDIARRYSPSAAAKFDAIERRASANAMNWAANAVNTVARSSNANMMANSDTDSPEAAERRRNAEASSLFAALSGKKAADLKAEDREKLVEKARQMAAKMRDPRDRVLALSVIAQQVALSGDKKTALEILRECESLLPPEPRTAIEYATYWGVAAAYAEVEPEEAFSRIETLIVRLNDMAEAAIKVVGFIDVGDNMMSEDELMLGQFASGRGRGMDAMLEQFTPTIGKLANFDLMRTSRLVDRVQRPELRTWLRLAILQTAKTDLMANAAAASAPEKKDDTPEKP